MGNWELKVNGFAEIKLMKSIMGLLIMPWWLKFCVFGRHREQYDRSTFIFQLAELLEKTEVEVQNSSELENEGEIMFNIHYWFMVILQTDPVVMLRTDGQLEPGALRWFIELITNQPQTVARVWFSTEMLRRYVNKDWINEYLLHDNPRKADPFPTSKCKEFVEVTLIKKAKTVFVVYIEREYLSDRYGAMRIECEENRKPIEQHYSREIDYEMPREDVMSGGPISVTFPNQFQQGNPENEPGKLEIHFDDLLVESIQRKSSQKRRKAERHRRAKKRDGPSKDHQPNEEDGYINP